MVRWLGTCPQTTSSGNFGPTKAKAVQSARKPCLSTLCWFRLPLHDWCVLPLPQDGSKKSQHHIMTADEVIAAGKLRLRLCNPLSGGRPSLTRNMAELVTKLKERGVTLAVETQGSRWQVVWKILTRSLSRFTSLLHQDGCFETLDFIVSPTGSRQVTFKFLSLTMQIWLLPEAYRTFWARCLFVLIVEILSPRLEAILSKTNRPLQELWNIAADDSWRCPRPFPSTPYHPLR